MAKPQILRLRDVAVIVGLDGRTILRREKAGDFPRRRRLGARSIGWLASEVERWIKSRPPVAE